MDTWLKVLISAVGFGAGAEALRQYQAWKSRRLDRPREVRNAGFWTDKRLLWTETWLVFGIVGLPFTVLAMASSWSLWQSYGVLLAYAGFSFLLVRGLNRYDPGP